MNKTWFTRISLFVVASLVLGFFAFAPAMTSQTASGAPRSPLQDIPVTGTVVGGGTFDGKLDIVSFIPNASNDGILANGILNGTLNTPVGRQTVADELVTIPVDLTQAQAQVGVCHILNLTLGPLDLNLLGLVVHLNQVHLTIDAERGPGNLLGNLLCAIVNLLNGNPLGDVLTQITGLLNRVIDLLG